MSYTNNIRKYFFIFQNKILPARVCNSLRVTFMLARSFGRSLKAHTQNGACCKTVSPLATNITFAGCYRSCTVRLALHYECRTEYPRTKQPIAQKPISSVLSEIAEQYIYMFIITYIKHVMFSQHNCKTFKEDN